MIFEIGDIVRIKGCGWFEVTGFMSDEEKLYLRHTLDSNFSEVTFKFDAVDEHYRNVVGERTKKLETIVNAVAHIGVDFGYGEYELEDKFITEAREIIE